jgi:hypothetical protein
MAETPFKLHVKKHGCSHCINYYLAQLHHDRVNYARYMISSWKFGICANNIVGTTMNYKRSHSIIMTTFLINTAIRSFFPKKNNLIQHTQITLL